MPRIFQNLSSLLKGHFFAGLLIIIPLAVIGWIVVTVVTWLWHLHTFVPEAWRPESYVESYSAAMLLNLMFTLAAALALALGLSFLGWGSKQYLGRKVLEWIGEIIQRIPVIRSVYSALDQLLRTMASGGGQQFSRVVYVEYPRKGAWTLAFVTGPARGPEGEPSFLNIYVPTTPNPTSGFHLIVPESDVRDSHMRVEEAFKTILSLGIAHSDTPEKGRR